MSRSRRKIRKSRPVLFALVVLVSLGLLVALLLRGADVALLNSKGQIAGEQSGLLVRSVVVLLAIAVPILTLLYFIAWKYRESNTKATYRPHAHGKLLVFSMWTIPVIAMLLLASSMWPATHKLAPQKLIGADPNPLKVQVVAMRWKWLFIYPEQSIATVNFVQVPAGKPVQFVLTADEAPMSSFWIPHWGGQLYAMTGHVNRLNLMASTPGDSAGSSAEINGAGFAGMKFTARASSKQAFSRWVQDIKLSPYVLDVTEYNKLLQPSPDNPAAFYAKADPDLFDKLLMKYNGTHNTHTERL